MNVAGRKIDDRYRLISLLGRGGMGEVWRAHDPRLDRQVAIKFLPPWAAHDGQGVARFRREARVTAGLKHPGITQVFDHGAQAGQLYLVMELLDGRDLGAVLRERPQGLPVDRAVELAAQVADALSHAHRAKIVHRDIKPANLMLLPDGRVKVCDFGLAGFIRVESELTHAGMVLGTPAYMAPEQAAQGRVDGRADLYALGCVLFALLTGRPPFTTGGWAVLVDHLNTPPPLLATLRPDVPDAVQRIVSGLLDKRPGARPTYAGLVAEQLRDLGRPPSRPVPEPPAGAPEPVGAGRPELGIEVFQNEYLPPDATEVNAIVRISGGAPRPEDLAVAAPRSLVFLLGLSAALPEADFRAVRERVADAVEGLDDGVAFAVVAGAEYARMLYPDTMRLVRANATTKAEARAALADLEPSGAAAFGRWIRLADRLFTAHAETVRTAILLTDLEATAESPDELAAALAASTGRFACHARGLGTAWSVGQLRAVTSALAGTLDIVAATAGPTAEKSLARELATVIDATRQPYARNLALRVGLPPGAGVRSVKQVTPVVEDLTDRGQPVGPGTVEYPVDVPGNGACEYHLVLDAPPGRAGERLEAAELTVVLLPPAGDGRTLARVPVLAVLADGPDRPSPHLARYADRADLARAIREGLDAQGDQGDQGRARR
ncbi:serine/threonine-protein kinase [Kitasatospora sp. NBC_00070]|uniref:serine/threonine-protein kinase n=1 Tax=Kitasatospora sp. NBC_00070 TaxID=2975962 RepID=UPI0032541642